MKSKVTELQELHNLLLAKAITNSEYEILKKEKGLGCHPTP